MEENNNLNIESENNSIKFKKKRTIILAVIFILLILVTIFLLFFKDDLFKKEVDKKDNNSEVKEEVKKTEDQLLVKRLLENDIPYIWTSDVNSKLYNKELVTFNDLDQVGLLGIIISKTPEPDQQSFRTLNISESKIISDLGKELAGNLINGGSIYITMYTVKNMIMKKYNIDNYDVNDYNEITKHENYSEFNITGGFGYIYDNYLFLMYGKGAINYPKETISYTYEKKDNELYIYEKMFIVEYTMYTRSIDCYINQISDIAASMPYNYDEPISETQLEKDTMNLCSPYAKTYKHTFKINSSGEYYWYSTEPYES